MLNIYAPRTIQRLTPFLDMDGIKLYGIHAHHGQIEPAPFLSRLATIKQEKSIDWHHTAAYAILHHGQSMRYLVLAWWGNQNELFTSVSVETPNGWIEDPSRYSFCVYDQEIMWAERNFYIKTLYCPQPSLHNYRQQSFTSPT